MDTTLREQGEQVADEKPEPIESRVSSVDQEVMVGSDMEFEDRWWRFVKVAWGVMVAAMALGLLGFFGRGPLNHVTKKSSDGLLQVRYERIAHFETPSSVEMEIASSAVQNGTAKIWVNKSMLKQVQIQRILPQPVLQASDQDGELLVIPATAANTVEVHIGYEPSTVGSFPVVIRVNESTASFHQLVFP